MGRNIHATRTAAPAMPYAPDLRILKDGDITPNARDEARRAKRAQRATDGESRRRLDHVCA
jgi:hypothetical protein